MLKEVLTRRFTKAIKESKDHLSLPELVIIDGGKGQYSTARNILDECGLYDLPIIAIAKGEYRNSGNETFFYKINHLNLIEMTQFYFSSKIKR